MAANNNSNSFANANVILLAHDKIVGDTNMSTSAKLFHHPPTTFKASKCRSDVIPVYSYAVMSRKGGFLRSELLQIMGHLAKCELLLSFLFLAYGVSRPWYGLVKSYSDMCSICVVAGVIGTVTGAFGFGALCKFRWKCLMVVYLVLSIISSVGYLLVLIFVSVWLGTLGDVKTAVNFVICLSVIVLLLSVAIGVCFILTSAFICNFWSHRQTEKTYRLLGNFNVPKQEEFEDQIPIIDEQEVIN